jgi:hypothetical protein
MRHARQNAFELGDIDWLDEIARGAQAQHLNGGLQAGVTGDQHSLRPAARRHVLEQNPIVAARSWQCTKLPKSMPSAARPSVFFWRIPGRYLVAMGGTFQKLP